MMEQTLEDCFTIVQIMQQFWNTFEAFDIVVLKSRKNNLKVNFTLQHMIDKHPQVIITDVADLLDMRNRS
jgi:hypothetical protein